MTLLFVRLSRRRDQVLTEGLGSSSDKSSSAEEKQSSQLFMFVRWIPMTARDRYA